MVIMEPFECDGELFCFEGLRQQNEDEFLRMLKKKITTVTI